MACPFCGSPNKADSTYCERCGVQLAGASRKSLDFVTNIEVCERCGGPMEVSGCARCVEPQLQEDGSSRPAAGKRTASLGAVLLFLGMLTTLVMRVMMPRVSEFEAAAVNTALGSGGILSPSAMRFVGTASVALIALGAVLLVVSALRKRIPNTAS